jgi:hypothetical protein
MQYSHREPTTARTTTTIWRNAGGRPLDRLDRKEEEDEGKGEKGGKRGGAGAGEGVGEGEGGGCDGSGSLGEYGQEYAEGIRIERKEKKGEEGGKRGGEGAGAGAGAGAGEGEGEGCDGSGSLGEYGQEYAEEMRIERKEKRRRGE